MLSNSFYSRVPGISHYFSTVLLLLPPNGLCSFLFFCHIHRAVSASFQAFLRITQIMMPPLKTFLWPPIILSMIYLLFISLYKTFHGLAVMHCCDVISLLSHPCSLNSSQSGPYLFSMGQTQFLCTR